MISHQARCARIAIFCLAMVASGSAPAALAPDPPLRHPMPIGWKLPPVTQHPCLLFGPEDVPAIKARLMGTNGSLEGVYDKTLLAYLTGDETSRRAATRDFIHYWKNYAQRWTKKNLDRDHPDGVAMRGVWRSVYLYDVVESFGFLTESERAEFRDALVQRIHWAIGPSKAQRRFQTGHWRHHNIYADVLVAAGTTALAFPELPEARDWIELAADELQWQLENSVWDGAWHECPRYQAHLLKTTGLFYQSLLRRTGVDQFQQPNYKAMLDWLIRFGTPRDKVAGKNLGLAEGVMLIPGIGDTTWIQRPYSLCAMFAPHYQKTDRAFAARLMWAWERAGKPDAGDTAEWAQVLIDPSLPAQPQTLGSDSSPGKGYILMRSGFDTPGELWFLLRCGRRTLTGHDNADCNAFNLYAFGYPLALDSGSGDYADPMHKKWNDQAIAHNTVVFGNRSQDRRDGQILSFISKPEADYSVSDASVPAGVERYVRTVLFVKPDYFVIWDQIKAKETADWVFHTTATDFQWAAHEVRCRTPWPVSLDVHVVLPETPLKPNIEKGIFESEKVQDNVPLPFQYQNYLKIPGAPGANFLTVLHPLKPGAPPLTIEHSGPPGRPVLAITCAAQHDVIELSDGCARLERNGPIQASVVFGGQSLTR